MLARGLKGISKDDLVLKLSSVNYYRLRGYTYPYQDNTVPDTPFLPSNDWGIIWADYIFDSRLRSFLFESIGHIEIALKTQLTLHMSLGHEPTWYTQKNYFFNKNNFASDFSELLKNWSRSKEKFKEHYEDEYNSAKLPPSWIIFETATFGVMSKYYGNLDNSISEKDKIARYFGFPHGCSYHLKSWLHHINIIRNICAHHSRLFSKANIITPTYPTLPGNWLALEFPHDKVYFSICIIKRLLDYCAPDYDFMVKFTELTSLASDRQADAMGFPGGWKAEALFNHS